MRPLSSSQSSGCSQTDGKDTFHIAQSGPGIVTVLNLSWADKIKLNGLQRYCPNSLGLYALKAAHTCSLQRLRKDAPISLLGFCITKSLGENFLESKGLLEAVLQKRTCFHQTTEEVNKNQETKECVTGCIITIVSCNSEQSFWNILLPLPPPKVLESSSNHSATMLLKETCLCLNMLMGSHKQSWIIFPERN